MSKPGKITSLSSYLKRIRRLRRAWNVPYGNELWFRGESRAYKTPLRPELFRPMRGATEIKSARRLFKIERDLYEEFQRLATQFVPDESRGDDWEWTSYFLMQHHGAPTRLLDWSDGALMALHFAVRNNDDDTHDAMVYILEPNRLIDELRKQKVYRRARTTWKQYLSSHPSSNLNKSDWEYCYLPIPSEVPQVPLVLIYDHLTRRIAAQRSQFIVFGTDHDWLAKRVGSSHEWIDAISIDAAHQASIRQELRDSGVTESVIFPDLDGVGRELRILWQDRRNRKAARP